MKCSNCPEEAMFKFNCSCALTYCCPSHFVHHISLFSDHSYEQFNIELPLTKLNRLKLELQKRIAVLKASRFEILSKTSSLIKLLDILSTETLRNLDQLIQKYFDLLGHQKFCQSEIETVNKIDGTIIESKPFATNNIHELINQVYSSEIISEKDNSYSKKGNFYNEYCGGFLCGAIMSDRQTLVIGCSDSTLRFWDLIQEKPMFVLFGHNAEVNCLALAGDCKYIITGSSDNSIRIWNFPLKTSDRILRGHKSSVLAICYIESKHLIISGCAAGELIIWDFFERKKPFKKSMHNSINCLVLMKSGRKLFCASGTEISFFELDQFYASGTEISLLSVMKNHDNIVKSMILTFDEKNLVSGTINKSIFVWKVKSDKLEVERELTHEKGIITSLAISLDDKFILSGSSDGPIRKWEIESGVQVNVLNEDVVESNSILCFMDKYIVIFANSKMAELSSDFSLLNLKYCLKYFETGSLTEYANSNLIGFTDKLNGIVYDLDTDACKCYLDDEDEDGRPLQFVEISNDGNFALTGVFAQKNNLYYWNINSGQKIGKLVGHKKAVLCANFSVDGFHAVTGSSDKNIIMWDLRQKKNLCQLTGHKSQVTSIKFMNNEENVVSGEENNIFIWDVRNKNIIRSFTGFKDKVSKLFVTMHDNYIISCHKESGLKIWNLRSEREENLAVEVETWMKKNLVPINLVKNFIKY